MRLIAATVLSLVFLSAAAAIDIPADDLKFLADKSTKLSPGQGATVSIMINGKPTTVMLTREGSGLKMVTAAGLSAVFVFQPVSAGQPLSFSVAENGKPAQNYNVSGNTVSQGVASAPVVASTGGQKVNRESLRNAIRTRLLATIARFSSNIPDTASQANKTNSSQVTAQQSASESRL